MEEQRRKELLRILSDTSGIPLNRVYFQPPSNTKMDYPCLVVHRDTSNDKKADNKSYIFHIRYSVTIINKDPSADIIEKLKELEMCTYDRWFASANLNHDVLTIWY